MLKKAKDVNITVRVPAIMKEKALKHSVSLDTTLSQVIRKALIGLIVEGERKAEREREAFVHQREFNKRFGQVELE